MTEASANPEPNPEEPTSSGIDDLLERLRARVEDRRASGDYPEGLEEELEAHFKRIVFHRIKTDTDQLTADVEALDSHASFTASRFTPESEVPGGELIHRAINKAVSRQTQNVLEQMQEFADAVRRVIRTLAVAVQDPTSHTHGDLVGHLDAVLERLGSYERAPVDSAAALGDLRRRVEELERAEAARGFSPTFTNEAFEESFRGTKEQLMKQYKGLAAEFRGCAPVLDVGCGRGEFLELLKAEGIEARGIEIDPRLAEQAQALGLQVDAGDGIAALAALDDESLGGIALIQVIEHLTVQQQVDLVTLAYEKLRKGGRIIVETVNPQSLYVYAHAFYIDPTHTRPVHPAYLAFLFDETGFAEVKWELRSPPPSQDVLEPVDDVPDSKANKNVERLNTLLFAPGDYALIVTK